MVARRSVKKIL